MSNDWTIEQTEQSRGYQPGQRVGMPQGGKEYRMGTILNIQRNPYGQEEASVQFDDLSYPQLILTAKLRLME